MSTYACSDLHGNYEVWRQIKEFLQPEDRLFMLGDCIDRGEDGWKILKEVLTDYRVEYILGNHDVMLLERDRNPYNYEAADLHNYNGGWSTWEMASNDPDVHYYMGRLKDCPYTVWYKNKEDKYIYMSHSGYEGDDKYELVWNRTEFYNGYHPDRADYIIHGHTPNLHIEDELKRMNRFILGDKKFAVPAYTGGAYWYNEYRCGLDCWTAGTGTAVLLDLNTFEEHIFSDEVDR